MPVQTRHPTRYPAVNATVLGLCADIRAILGSSFAGMYLDGSLASGDFDPASSDIDFVVTTTTALPDAIVAALAAMHERFAAGDSPWARRLEGSYIPQDDLRDYDATRHAPGRFPRIEMGSPLAMAQHDKDWLFHRAILHDHGLVVLGPAPHTWIEPVAPDDLRRAMAGTLGEWWALMLDDPGPLRDPGYRAYCILTMCRALYTFEHGRVTSKPAAAAWVQAAGGAPWGDVVGRALAIHARGAEAGVVPATIEEAQAAIRYVLARASRQARPGWS
jgi:hypothetical protein